MTIRVQCDSCNQQFDAVERLIGQTRACPRCGHQLVIAPMPVNSLPVDPLSPPNKPETPVPVPMAVAPVAGTPVASSPAAHAEAQHAAGAAVHGPDPFSAPKKSSNPSDLIDMTAMVDIVFFLLIYFLVTSFVQLIAAINAPASQATVGRIAKGPDRPEGATLTVRIDADDVVWIEQDAVFGHPEVYQRLKQAHDELGVERLKVAASSEATHGTLVLVLDAGINAKFTSAQLAIEEVQ